MFRKLVALLLVLSCVLSVTVAASAGVNGQRFELRAGICLGDSFETVLEKNDLGFESENYATYSENDNGIYYVWTKKGTIAGIENAQMRFRFENRILTGVMYQFPEHSTASEANSEYTKLRQSLVKKYGTPIGNRNGTIELITSCAIDYAALIISLWKGLLEGDGDLVDYEEWKYTEFSDYNVKIEIVDYYFSGSTTARCYYNVIGYYMYTDADEAAAIAARRAELEAADNDL